VRHLLSEIYYEARPFDAARLAVKMYERSRVGLAQGF
jgi:hypothetical protein